jgi:hypothetical protein
MRLLRSFGTRNDNAGSRIKSGMTLEIASLRSQ